MQKFHLTTGEKIFKHFLEPMTRIELVTSSLTKEALEPMRDIEPMTSKKDSLPRKRSTPELHRLTSHRNCKKSGRRDSNSRPSAWKADALPTELLPLILNQSCSFVGRAGFEPAKVKPADLQSALVGRLSISPK